jgi:cytochrome c oxidase subunit II
MKTKSLKALAAKALLGVAVAGGSVDQARAAAGQPVNGQFGLQDSVTPVMDAIAWLHNSWVNPMIIVITAFVMLLLLIVIFRFSEKNNPVPSKTTHNTLLEVGWTVIPIFILIAISIPSFKLLYFQYSFPKPDITIKAIGNAWYWEHEYLDEKGVKVTSNMIKDEDLLKQKLGEGPFNAKYAGLTEIGKLKAMYADAKPLWAETRQVRQLSVNNEIAVPVNKTVHMLVTSNDVIHSWTIPSFGSKMQAVPGRITATWFKPTKEGLYFGQCSVLCGKDHSGMPIAIRVVSDKAYADWLAAAKARDWRRARTILQAATDAIAPVFADTTIERPVGGE